MICRTAICFTIDINYDLFIVVLFLQITFLLFPFYILEHETMYDDSKMMINLSNKNIIYT